MAHSTNRSTDFAPAWLKLPEQSQEQRKQEAGYHSSHSSSHSSSHYHTQHRGSVGGHSQQHSANSCSASTLSQLNNPDFPSHHYQQSSTSAYQQHQSPSHHHNHNQPQAYHHQQQQHNNAPSNHHHRPGRPPLNSYSSTFSLRSGTGAPPSQQHLQRSQSTGSYNDNVARAAVTTPQVVSRPLEEEFPLLRSGPSAVPPGLTQPSPNNQVNTTAQWRIKERPRDEANTKNAVAGQGTDNLLTSNMTGKVYRAQVKPVKRSNMIPISNGTTTGNIAIKTRENGDHQQFSGLSSSLDKEKKFLQELGWNEDEESDDDCIIPEQDPAQLLQIMEQAKEARKQRLLMKNKQTLKPVPTAKPNEEDSASSSDNSDLD